MGQDPIKYTLWIGGVSLAITLACALYIVWVNGGSRNLALGLGALAGAYVIFVLQIAFELKGTTASSDFAVEFVIDYQQMSIRSAVAYHQSIIVASGYRNSFVEFEASKVIAAATPPLTKDDAPKIARDLGIAAIVSYLLDEQSDWQLDTRSFRISTGVMTQWVRLSTPKECTSVGVEAIREKLRAAGNMFAGAQIGMMSGPGASICLPPDAELDITKNSVAIRSLVCSIVFTLQEPFASMMTIDPHAVALGRATGKPINAEVPTLPNGAPRYETVAITARATVEFQGLRAQDRDLVKYQSWANRVSDGVKARFEQGVLQGLSPI